MIARYGMSLVATSPSLSMFTDKIEEIGVEPYLNTSYAKEWPTLIGQNWPGESQFDLNNVTTRYFEVSIGTLYIFYITRNLIDPSVNAIYLSEADLYLPRSYLIRLRNDSFLMAYERYLREKAIYLGAEPGVAAQDATDVLNLEIELAKIMDPPEEQWDPFKFYNPTTLAELGTNYSYLDIPRALRAAFSIANRTVDDNQEIIVPHPSYFNRLEAVINSTSNRTLQNFFGFKYALREVGGLTERLRQLNFDLLKVYLDITESEPRWQTCLRQVRRIFYRGLGKEFVRRHFSEDSKAYINEMIANLRAVFREILEEATWMGNETKAEAYQKLDAMSSKIGYPDHGFSDEELEEKHKYYVMTPNNLYQNRQTLFWNAIILLINKTYNPPDKNEWFMASYDVNAYYSRRLNEIVFPAGILQPPFFWEKFPDSMNYGAIGMIIGHEIVHGFDNRGRQYDKDGRLRNWWQPEDLDGFKGRSQCIINQYGNFTDELAEMKLNGVKSQGENVADNGGLKGSYRAYKKLTAGKEDGKLLPGLNLTHDQLFFLSFAQQWCHKSTKARAIADVTNGKHVPGNFRIFGSLQNSPDFARAYNCTLGSPMNPQSKCSVW
ncbi:endothelin-converting enzyme 1 [Plakobranchus ocellatus]|uniref:Endothelin-converting enzyme 1 n=1 Tax=Plakobranchus ocellatus TaxID=259542 RepID=A0AAV4C2W9_9GAST|nr:endothelin-converting enzyme 1 [Plakobranchus ocellatus]